jgi:hypothetical protein
VSKRLQVVMNEAELRGYERAARAADMPLSEWVRRALRGARQAEPGGGVDKKLAAIRAAARHQFPAPNIDQMLSEIAQGYGPSSWRICD